jgi:hypothetical protein
MMKMRKRKKGVTVMRILIPMIKRDQVMNILRKKKVLLKHWLKLRLMRLWSYQKLQVYPFI